jgi:cytochrome d ubiquinol oxidase subunit I
MWMRRGDQHYSLLAQFWTKIFAVSFAMGVVSGVVLSYQFGTQLEPILGRARHRRRTDDRLRGARRVLSRGDVSQCAAIRLGPGAAMAAHALGHRRRARYIALGVLDLVGQQLDAEPAGYEMRDGIVYPLDWLAIVFNPSFPYCLAHTVTAVYLTTLFVVLAVRARYLLAGKHLGTAEPWSAWPSVSPPSSRRCSS